MTRRRSQRRHGRLSSLILFCMVLIFNRKIMISRFHVTVCNMLFLFLLSALKEGFVPVKTDAPRWRSKRVLSNLFFFVFLIINKERDRTVNIQTRKLRLVYFVFKKQLRFLWFYLESKVFWREKLAIVYAFKFVKNKLSLLARKKSALLNGV